MGFASTLFGKLDNFRETSMMASAMNSYAAYTKVPYTKAPIPMAVNPWSFYMLGNGAYSERQATVASNGFTLDSVGGTIGTEYRINNNAFVGAAFDYSNPQARASSTMPVPPRPTRSRSAATAPGPTPISSRRDSPPMAG